MLAFAPAANATTAPLTQGFEDGAPAWGATGMWHVQSNPEAVQVIPAIADNLVTLPDAGFLPAPASGSSVAWFGQASTGTYCGADYATVKQTPNDGCTSVGPEVGTLTSPVFSLAGHAQAILTYGAWWEIEAVNADIADLMQVEYSTDGGATWLLAQTLNPLDPAWGGGHQNYSDAGVRTSGVWQDQAVDLSGAGGADQVQVRFVFDTVDASRNGFRGLLLDDLAIVDGIGAPIQTDDTSGFSDDPPDVTIGSVNTQHEPNGHWNVGFHLGLSHRTPHPVTVHWKVKGNSGTTLIEGDATIPAGQPDVPINTDVPAADPPATITISDAGGGTIPPGGGTVPAVGSTPNVTVGPVTTSDGGGGLADVTFAVEISAATPQPVTVDYTIIGAEGVIVATGTVTIPPGETTVTTTVTVSAAHAPFTVSLSSPTGATIPAGGGSSSSSPPVASAAGGPGGGPSSQPGQLVLGARQTGSGSGPVLGKFFELTYVSGTLRYHQPGKSYKPLPSGHVVLPMGSVVDATNGRARISVESDDQGNVQTGDFYQGAFGVFQPPGKQPVTTLQLAAGDYSTCAGASSKHGSRKRSARSAKSKVVRSLWGDAKGRFRTKGRFASATIRGTRWLTEDLCLATRITVAEGIVNVFDFRRKQATSVTTGHSLTVGALQSARYKKRRGVHAPKLSRVGG